MAEYRSVFLAGLAGNKGIIERGKIYADQFI
jgi:hypothetical protein